MSKIKQELKVVKNNKIKPKQSLKKIEGCPEIIQFHPYQKNLTEHIDNVIVCLRRTISLANTYYSQYQKVSKDIQTSLVLNVTHKFKCLELLLILIQLQERYLILFKNKFLYLIIDYAETLDTNLALFALKKYFKLQKKIISQMEIKIFFPKLAKNPSNQILWTILTQVIRQTQQFSQSIIIELSMRLLFHINSYQLPPFVNLDLFQNYYHKFIDSIITSKNISIQFPLFQTALFSMEQLQNQFFTKIVNQIDSLKFQDSFKTLFLSKLLIAFDEKENKFSDAQKFSVLMNYHQLFQKTEFTDQIIINHLQLIFKLVSFCDRIKHSNQVQSLLQNLSKLKLKSKRYETWNYNYCSSVLYNIVFEVEKILSHYQLKFYCNLYTQNPQIFQQSFFDKILQNSKQEQKTQLIIKLIQKWTVSNKICNFNLFNLLTKYIKNIMKGTGQQLGKLINGLSIFQIQSLNMLIYKESFDINRGERKSMVPKTLSSYERFTDLISGGYADQNLFINRHFPMVIQNVVWKPLLDQFQKRQQFLITKYFYSAINEYYFNNKQARFQILQQLVSKLQKGISSELEVVCCSLHLILVISMNNQNTKWLNKKLVDILIQNFDKISNLYEEAYKQRTKCMKYVRLSQQDIKNNTKMLDRCKRMNKMMMKNWIRFMDNCGKQIVEILPPKQSLQQFMAIIDKIAKQSQSSPHAIIRRISSKCSKNIFMNHSIQRIRQDACTLNDYYIYRQVIYAQSQAKSYEEYSQVKDINSQKVLELCLKGLQKQLDISCERQLLKIKLICLETIKTMAILCQSKFVNQKFKNSYLSKKKIISSLILNFMYKNSKLLGKYQRQLIVHIRCFILVWILQSYKTNTNIINNELLFPLLINLSVDQSVEIRIILLSCLFSRYKQKFKRIRFQLHGCIAISCIMLIYDPCQSIKSFTKIVVGQFENQPQIICLVGLIMCFIANNFYELIPPKSLLQYFVKYLLKNKQVEYNFYLLIEQIQKRKLIIKNSQESEIKSEIISYYISRLGSDSKSFRQFQDSNSIFNYIKQYIRQKPRNTRMLKGKKQLIVQWSNLKMLGFICQKVPQSIY